MLNARFLGPHGQPPIVDSAAIDRITTDSADSRTFNTGSESILDRPLVSIKVDETLAWLVYILLALLLLRALFNPHKDAREAWETCGFTVLPIVLVIAGTWLLLPSLFSLSR
jgi:hypothetical protein